MLPTWTESADNNTSVAGWRDSWLALLIVMVAPGCHEGHRQQAKNIAYGKGREKREYNGNRHLKWTFHQDDRRSGCNLAAINETMNYEISVGAPPHAQDIAGKDDVERLTAVHAICPNLYQSLANIHYHSLIGTMRGVLVLSTGLDCVPTDIGNSVVIGEP
jgi:hypothetical protein